MVLKKKKKKTAEALHIFANSWHPNSTPEVFASVTHLQRQNCKYFGDNC